jgi:hypothetical protein
LHADSEDPGLDAIQAFSEFVVRRILSPVRRIELPIDYSQFRTAEFMAREISGDDLASYFCWSFAGRVFKHPKGWLGAFWQLRNDFGSDFTDSLLAHMVKSFAQGPSPFGKRKFDDGVITLPHEYIDHVLYSHLEQAEKTVDNQDKKLPAIRKILAMRGLSLPS